MFLVMPRVSQGPQLPQELIDLIIDERRKPHPHSPLELETLSNLSLVARSFRGLCRSHIFEEIRIMIRSPNPPVCSRHDERLRGIHSLLQQNRDLASRVRSSVLYYPEVQTPTFLSLFPEIARSLRGLTSISIVGTCGEYWNLLQPEVFTTISEICALPSILELTIYDLSHLPGDFFLSCSPSLKNLNLGRVYHTTEHEWRIKQRLPSPTPSVRDSMDSNFSVPWRLDRLVIENGWQPFFPLLVWSDNTWDITKLTISNKVNGGGEGISFHNAMSTRLINKVSETLTYLCLMYSDIPCHHYLEIEDAPSIPHLPSLRRFTMSFFSGRKESFIACSGIVRFLLRAIAHQTDIEALVLGWPCTYRASPAAPSSITTTGGVTSTNCSVPNILSSMGLKVGLEIRELDKPVEQKLRLARQIEGECCLALRGTIEKVAVNIEATVKY